MTSYDSGSSMHLCNLTMVSEPLRFSNPKFEVSQASGERWLPSAIRNSFALACIRVSCVGFGSTDEVSFANRQLQQHAGTLPSPAFIAGGRAPGNLTNIMEPIDKLHSPLTAARALATLAQTSTQVRALVLRFLPVRELKGSAHASSSRLPYESNKTVNNIRFAGASAPVHACDSQ